MESNSTNNNYTNHHKIYPVNSGIDNSSSTQPKVTTTIQSSSPPISSTSISTINRKAFVIDDFDKHDTNSSNIGITVSKALDESDDSMSWVPRSPLTSETTYRSKSSSANKARRRYDQAFIHEEGGGNTEEHYEQPMNNNRRHSQQHYYQEATVANILSTTLSNDMNANIVHDGKKTKKQDCVKPKSAPPTFKRNHQDTTRSSTTSSSRSPFRIIKELLRVCRHSNDVQPDENEIKVTKNSSTLKKVAPTTAQEIQVEKTEVVVFNRNNADITTSPKMNRKIKCGNASESGFQRSSSHQVVVPLYYHVFNGTAAADNLTTSKTSSGELEPHTNANYYDFSPTSSLSEVQEME